MSSLKGQKMIEPCSVKSMLLEVIIATYFRLKDKQGTCLPSKRKDCTIQSSLFDVLRFNDVILLR